MPVQVVPYEAFAYCAERITTTGTETIGGFSEASGLPSPSIATDARVAGGPAGPLVHLAGTYQVSDVTLKCGVVNSGGFWSWIDSVRGGGSAVVNDAALITLCDETHQPVQQWKLQSATPKHWAGPELSGKGTGDVAVEELVLSAEFIEIVSPG